MDQVKKKRGRVKKLNNILNHVINFKVTEENYLLMQNTAKVRGFDYVAEYIRFVIAKDLRIDKV